MKPRRVIDTDLMQTGYEYVLSVPVGQCRGDGFWPDLTPKQMLSLGVFGGKYTTDCAAEFPAEWLSGAKLCCERHDPALNCFGILASQPLTVWREKGWIYKKDPRGWFQWYCRYYMGRRCEVGDVDCRPRQMNRCLHVPTTHEIFDAPPSAARAIPLSIPGKTKPCSGTTEYQ